jgi:hypothetical protein
MWNIIRPADMESNIVNFSLDLEKETWKHK